jgi:hypothetical protein
MFRAVADEYDIFGTFKNISSKAPKLEVMTGKRTIKKIFDQYRETGFTQYTYAVLDDEEWLMLTDTKKVNHITFPYYDPFQCATDIINDKVNNSILSLYTDYYLIMYEADTIVHWKAISNKGANIITGRIFDADSVNNYPVFHYDEQSDDSTFERFKEAYEKDAAEYYTIEIVGNRVKEVTLHIYEEQEQ